MKTLVVLSCLVAGTSSAGSLYRCVGPAGEVSYQSDGCRTGQRTDRIIEFVPDTAGPPVSVASTRTARRPVVPDRYHQDRSTGNAGKSKPDPCRQAKARRETQLQNLGLKRTFDDLSRIDAAVRAVCKGF